MVPSAAVDRASPASYVDPGKNEGWAAPPGIAAETLAIGRTNRPYPAAYGESNISWTKIGGEPDFVDVTSAHPKILKMVEALVGGPVKVGNARAIRHLL